jgi:hypothetical protein
MISPFNLVSPNAYQTYHGKTGMVEIHPINLGILGMVHWVYPMLGVGKSPGRPSNRQTTLLPLDSPQTIMVS